MTYWFCSRGTTAARIHFRTRGVQPLKMTVQSVTEIDTPDSGRGKNLWPDNGRIRPAVKHILSKSHVMRRWANELHEILQKLRHAFHRCHCPGKQHIHQYHRDCQQPELAHRGSNGTEKNAKRCDREHIKARAPQK